MVFLQELKKNISIYGELKNSVLNLLFRVQLLNNPPWTVTVNIKIRGKIQISLKEPDELQNLELVSQFFPPQSKFCTKLEELPQSLARHPNQNSNPR